MFLLAHHFPRAPETSLMLRFYSLQELSHYSSRSQNSNPQSLDSPSLLWMFYSFLEDPFLPPFRWLHCSGGSTPPLLMGGLGLCGRCEGVHPHFGSPLGHNVELPFPCFSQWNIPACKRCYVTPHVFFFPPQKTLSFLVMEAPSACTLK